MSVAERTFGGYDANVYYNPAEAGFELLAEVEDRDVGSYEFDFAILLRDRETGKLYAAHDSGCSCPTPFEDVRTLGDLIEIRSVADVMGFIRGLEYFEPMPDAASAFLRAAQEVLGW